MASPAVQLQRKPLRTITPCIGVHQAASVVDFAKRAFDAEQLSRSITPAGLLHCELQIGDSAVMAGGGLQWRGKPKPAALHLYLDDVDAVFDRAIAVGAKQLQAPTDRDYGSRDAGVMDSGGNHWYLSTLLPSRQDTPEFIPRNSQSVAPYLHPAKSGEVIDFLKNAFGAEETYRARSPDGTVHHAQVRIGDSTIEMGDAHDLYHAMPMVFYVSVDDPEAASARAIAAGASPLKLTSSSPFTRAKITLSDPFGNEWYLANAT